MIETALLGVKASLSLAAALKAKALLPPSSSVGLWGNVAGLEPDSLREMQLKLEREGVLVDGEFVHPLYRQVVFDLTSVEQRCALARRAISVLEDADPETAAGFILHAECSAASSLDLLSRAAQVALARKDNGQAGRWLAEAVDFATAPVQTEMALRAAELFM